MKAANWPCLQPADKETITIKSRLNSSRRDSLSSVWIAMCALRWLLTDLIGPPPLPHQVESLARGGWTSCFILDRPQASGAHLPVLGLRV